MKTTKEIRAKMRYARHFLDSPAAEEMEKLLDDIDTLTEKLKARDALLERAKESFIDVALRIAKREPQDLVSHVVWLADLAALSEEKDK